MKIKTFCILLVLPLMILSVCTSTSTLNAGKNRPPGSDSSYIDAHNHLHGRFRSHGGSTELDYEGAARIALAAMEQYGIMKMIIMPPPFPPDHPHRYDFDDFIGVVKKYPDRFVFLGGGGTLNAMIQQTAHDKQLSPKDRSRFEKTAREILTKGALGFGEMTAEHFSLGPDHPYESTPPDHLLFLLLADIAAEQDVPIDIHMEAVPEEMPLPDGLRSPPNPKVLKPNIAAFERLLAHNRKAKIIWAHVGWCNTGHRTAALCAELLRRHPNLYMSFKITPQDSRPECMPIERGIGLKDEWLALLREFPGRFIIGTDQFYISPRASMERIGPSKAKITNKFFSLLPPDLARTIGRENPRRIFNLNE